MILDSYLFGSNFGKIGKKWLAWFFNSVTGECAKRDAKANGIQAALLLQGPQYFLREYRTRKRGEGDVR